jgi:hypothetical protein
MLRIGKRSWMAGWIRMTRVVVAAIDLVRWELSLLFSQDG